MSRPIEAKNGTLCQGAAGDAVEIQQAGGMNKFKQSLKESGYLDGFKDGYKEGYQDATEAMEARISKLEEASAS
jgi:flagellar biosynthesis/type III secretory pathway protein FliH